MAKIILTFAAAALLCSACRTHKSVESSARMEVDSVAATVQQRAVITLDSLAQHVDFAFDTLKINIVRPQETIRLTATNGRVISRRRSKHQQLELSASTDTVTYKATASTESKTIEAKSPGASPSLMLLLFVIIAVTPFFYRRS